MQFFEGVWQPLGRNSYGLTNTVTVTAGSFSWDDINDVEYFRVLAEQQNYVLLAIHNKEKSIDGVTEFKYWTTYVILRLQYFDNASERHPEQADMIYNYCSDLRLNGEKDFQLSKVALLSMFATSFCRRDIFSHAKPTNFSFGYGGWGGYAFARITDANRGMGWLRMRRNEKILGLPQGTVPEPKD